MLSLAGYSDWHPYVQQAIDASGDTNTYKYLNGNSNNGAPAGHALQKYHKILGLNLAAYIRTLMGWNGKVYETVADTANSNISVNLPQSFYKAGDTVTFTPSVTGGQVAAQPSKPSVPPMAQMLRWQNGQQLFLHNAFRPRARLG